MKKRVIYTSAKRTAYFNKVRAILAIPLKPCPHKKTYIVVVPESVGPHDIVIDGASEERCAELTCNELIRVLV